MLMISTLTYKNAAAGQGLFAAVRRLFFDGTVTGGVKRFRQLWKACMEKSPPKRRLRRGCFGGI